MTAIADLLPMILPFVRDCSEPAGLVAARFACSEFYKTTLWQQEQLDPVDLIAGQGIYELEVPPNTMPTCILRAEVEGLTQPLTFIDKDTLDQQHGAMWTTWVGTPKYVTQFEETDACLVPAPDADAPMALKLLVAVHPTLDAMEMGEDVFNRYAEGLAYGARARLVETAGQPYYDPNSAPMMWGRFYGAVSEAKARRQRDHTRAVMHVQVPKW